jgi:DNA-binding MarR family transcriptional regulator
MHRSADDDRLTDAFLASSRALVAVAARSMATVEDEVTLPQFRALVVIHGRGPQTVGALARELGVAPSTATRLCDRLVSKGLVTRDQTSDDRREVVLDLSTNGRRLVGLVSRLRKSDVHRIVSSMDQSQASALVEALEAFTIAAGEVPEDQWYLGWV